MIGVFGINHKTATQDIREKFSFSQEEVVPFGESVLKETEIEEIVILSTCNRTEIYFFQGNTGKDPFSELSLKMHAFKKVEKNHTNCFYTYSDNKAVTHLFEVTSGIDSMVIGEDQIVGQVKEAFMLCTEAALTGAVLMRLFQKSFETGKRVRTETSIQQGATSVSYVAVDLCSSLMQNKLADKTVLFIGAGETGRLALENMKKRGARNIYISNRTKERAEILAHDFHAVSLPFHEYKDFIPQCDIILVATSSRDNLILREDILSSLTMRNGKEQVLVDLSVPRNIDKEIDGLENIRLITVDDCQVILDQNNLIRHQSIHKAHEIIPEMVDAYCTWLESLTLRPIIKTITNNLQKLKEQERSYFKRLKDPEMIQVMDSYADHLTDKYIRVLIRNLKEITKDGQSTLALKALNDLFTFE